MRFLTYNIKVGIQQGLEPIADIIRAAQADVVALQEVGCYWKMGPPGDTTNELAAMTGLKHSTFVRTIVGDKPESGFGHALLSRWPLRNLQVFQLPQASIEARQVLAASVAPGGQELMVVATHLSHLPDERALQVPVFKKIISNFLTGQTPVVIMGDLNSDDNDPWIVDLLKGFADADAEQRRRTFPAIAPTVRIDYLLVHSGRWKNTGVLAYPDATDHFGLVSDLLLKKQD